MELDIKKSFKVPFSQEKWYIKLIFPSIMAIFSLISNNLMQTNKPAVAILFLITLIPAIILNGFFLQFAHNEINDEYPLLPNLKSRIKEYLKYGAKYYGLIIIYAVILFFAGLLIGFASGFILGFLGLDKTLLSILTIAIFLPLLILVCCYLILVYGVFSDKFNFKEAFMYKKIMSLLSKVKAEITVYLLVVFGLLIVLSAMFMVLSIFKITLIIAPVLVAVQQLIAINLKAQVYKIAKTRLNEQVQSDL